MALSARHPGDRRHRDAGVPGRRHLPGAGLPRIRKAILPARIRLVGGVPRCHRHVVLRQGRRRVLAHLARHLLLRRPDRADRLPPRAVPHGAALDPARTPGQARRRRRRRRERRHADHCAHGAARFRHSHRRRVRRPRRRSRAHGRIRASQARQGRRSRRIRTPHAYRPRHLLAADLGRSAHPAHAQEAVGAAGRHSPRRARQQAALPPARLFLHRQRPGARRLRQADHGLGRRDEMAVRQDHRHARADRGGRR